MKGKVISSHRKVVKQIQNTDNDEKDNYYITTKYSTTKGKINNSYSSLIMIEEYNKFITNTYTQTNS